MNLDQLRHELLAQHGALRQLIERARSLAGGIRRGEGGREEELRDLLGRLARALDAHSRSEEAALGPILPTVDAWGKERATLMHSEHTAEHEALVRAAATAAFATAARLAGATEMVALELLEHMAAEDRYLLDPSVLTDDPVKIEHSG